MGVAEDEVLSTFDLELPSFEASLNPPSLPASILIFSHRRIFPSALSSDEKFFNESGLIGRCGIDCRGVCW